MMTDTAYKLKTSFSEHQALADLASGYLARLISHESFYAPAILIHNIPKQSIIPHSSHFSG